MKDHVEIDGRTIPLRLFPNKQAKRLILRLDPKTGGVKVTLPPYADPEDALDMVKRHEVWIINQLGRNAVSLQQIKPGMRLPFKGQDLPIYHEEDLRGTVHFDEDRIRVCGARQFFERRLKDGLKKQARLEIHACAYPLADQINRKISKITLRDTVSRWGSCTAKGGLNFNWRLIMAPPAVLKYVVAHEVAHLQEMNHSAAFWAMVERLHPDYHKERHWLKKNGARLQSYPLS